MSYRAFHQPHGASGKPPILRRDPAIDAAASVLFVPLPRPTIIPRPRWIGFARALGTLLLALAVMLAFVSGAVGICRVVSGPYLIVVLLAYAVAFGWLCRKARL